MSSGKGDGRAEGEVGSEKRRAGRNREGGVEGRPGEGASSVLSLGGTGKRSKFIYFGSKTYFPIEVCIL